MFGLQVFPSLTSPHFAHSSTSNSSIEYVLWYTVKHFLQNEPINWPSSGVPHFGHCLGSM